MINVSCMQAVTWTGNQFEVNVSTLPVPHILEANDAIVKISLSAINSADIDVYQGVDENREMPWVMGNEGLGIIVDIGDSVTSFSNGDKVVYADHAFYERGLGAGYVPSTTGFQAEYVRVSFANDNLLPIPYNNGDLSNISSLPTLDYDYLLASGIFAEGWGALDLSGYQTGDSVAVFGAGPVGLMAVYSAMLRGASRVFLVDHNRQRLAIAEGLGAIPIDSTHTNPAASLLRQEPDGVIRSVDCVDIEAAGNFDAKSDKVLQNMKSITRAEGGIGRVNKFKPSGDSSSTSVWQSLLSTIQLQMTGFFTKSPRLNSGTIVAGLIAPQLIELISNGQARPSFIVSSIISLDRIPEFYQRASQDLETKVVIKFLSP